MNMLKIITGVLGSLSIALMANTVVGNSATISFEKGNSVLTAASRNKLKELVTTAERTGKINEIQLATWSDNPAPREGEELSKVDKELAEARKEIIVKYLKSLKVSDVDSYNMAERANWLSRTFQTDGAELKAEVGQGADMPMSKKEFQVFKDKGGPSKAVVLVMLKAR